jgi:hypothetical protein
MGAISLIVGLLPLRQHHPIRPWFLAAGVLLALIAVAQPKLLHYPNLVWSRFGLLVGRVMQPVIMTILFFGVFTPIGLFRRLWRANRMRTFRDDSLESYWLPRIPPGPSPDTMRNQF